MKSNDTYILLTAGMTLGALVGATFGVSLASPGCDLIAKAEGNEAAAIAGCLEFWFARYQGLAGGLLAVVGAAFTVLAVFRQIASSEAQAAMNLRAAYHRELANWERADGSTMRYMQAIRDEAQARLSAISPTDPQNAFTYALSLHEGNKDQLYVVRLAEQLDPLPKITQVEMRRTGLSPHLAADFSNFAEMIAQAEKARSYILKSISGSAGPATAYVDPKAVADYIIQLLLTLDLASQAIERAERTKPVQPF